MRGDFDEDEDDNQSYDFDDSCERCGGEGVILVCIDDMCHGAGECLHGDGYAPCPVCCTQPSPPRRTETR